MNEMARSSPSDTSFTQPSLLALPLALFAALIFVHIDGIPQILGWLCTMVFHELGHAVIYWFRSIVAIPTFGVTLPLHASSSIFVFLAFAALAMWGYLASKKAGLRFLSAVLGGFFVLLVIFSVLLPSRVGESVVLYGGLGGELYLAVLAIVAFHHQMPRRFAWERNRYFFLALGSISFCAAALRWYRAQSDRSQLPMGGLFDFGALLSDNSESNGDLDRLMREFGWTADTIISSYVITTLVCIAVLIGYYCYLWYSEIHRPE